MTATDSSERSIWHAVGPGIVFAGAAVGVSHLVQSTRAGATYGLSLLLVVLVANAVKYPAFRFGPQYAAATGTSMLEGYRRRGRWALALYAVLTLATMFTVQAAVTFVTAGLALHVFGSSSSPVVASALLLASCVALLMVGRYAWLDRITKVAVAVFTVATLVATVGAVSELGTVTLVPDFSSFTTADVLFLAALVGWMPSAIDVSVWQSLWTLARARDSGKKPSVSESMFDFHLGYFGTAVLAVCFLVLGAGVMHDSGVEIAGQPHAFAGQLVDLYVQTLGNWSRPIIAASAFLVMFSTTLTVTDGFPRAISVLVARFTSEELPVDPSAQGVSKRHRGYWAAMAVISIGAMTVLAVAITSLRALVDIATTASFLTAPVLSWLNHRAIMGEEVPALARPPAWLYGSSWAGIVLQSAFALYYLWLKLGLG